MTVRNVRNNNPGNIDYIDGVSYAGLIGRESGGGRFMAFDSPESGAQALAELVLYKQSPERRLGPPLMTVADLIHSWAPPNENNTGAYINAVASDLGVGAYDRIDLKDDPIMLAKIVTAITAHEGGDASLGTFTPAVISEGVSRALANPGRVDTRSGGSGPTIANANALANAPAAGPTNEYAAYLAANGGVDPRYSSTDQHSTSTENAMNFDGLFTGLNADSVMAFIGWIFAMIFQAVGAELPPGIRTDGAPADSPGQLTTPNVPDVRTADATQKVAPSVAAS